MAQLTITSVEFIYRNRLMDDIICPHYIQKAWPYSMHITAEVPIISNRYPVDQCDLTVLVNNHTLTDVTTCTVKNGYVSKVSFSVDPCSFLEGDLPLDAVYPGADIEIKLSGWGIDSIGDSHSYEAATYTVSSTANAKIYDSSEYEKRFRNGLLKVYSGGEWKFTQARTLT